MSDGQKSDGRRRGCVIAAAVAAAVMLVCGCVVTLIGWSIWESPTVQRGVQIAGAAMEMTQEAMRAPGAAELRQAGCLQALVYTPDIIRRFGDTIRPDGGIGNVPEDPLVVCAVRRESPMTCEEVARAYGAAVQPTPSQIGVTVQRQGQREPVCQAVYGPDGTFLREAGRDQQRIGNMGQTTQP